MNELEQYILSTFNKAINIDSVQFSTNQYLCKLNKNLYKVFITPIKIPELKKFQAKYNSLVINALNMWSQALFETDIKFEIINTPHKADIKLYWGKVNINYAGMQYYEQNAGLKTLCVCIGLITPDKIVLSDEDVFHVILHEFGHILGLGHSQIH